MPDFYEIIFFPPYGTQDDIWANGEYYICYVLHVTDHVKVLETVDIAIRGTPTFNETIRHMTQQLMMLEQAGIRLECNLNFYEKLMKGTLVEDEARLVETVLRMTTTPRTLQSITMYYLSEKSPLFYRDLPALLRNQIEECRRHRNRCGYTSFVRR